MPKSLVNVVEELVKSQSPSKDAPTRFDLYDLQRSIDALTEAKFKDKSDLEDSIGDLSAQVIELTAAIVNLTAAVERLSDREDK